MNVIAIGKALEAPSRRTALALVEANGPLPIGVLARRVGVSSSTMTHHVIRLKQAGLAVTKRQGRTTYVLAAWKWLDLMGVRREG